MTSYVEKALIGGERVLYVGRVSNWALLWPYWLLGVLLLPIVVGLFFLIAGWIRRATTELAVTNKRVILKIGLLRRDTFELHVQKIESVQVRQGVLGRMLGYGDIEMAGGGIPAGHAAGIADPLGFRRAFLEAQEQSLNARSGAPAAPVA